MAHLRIMCVEVHFEDGTLRHMTLDEFDLYRRDMFREAAAAFTRKTREPALQEEPYYAGKEQGLPDPQG